MATEEEISALLDELEALLNDLGLGFIVTQERVLAAEGLSQPPSEVAGQTGGKFGGYRHLYVPDVGMGWSESVHRSTRRARFKTGDAVVTPLHVRDRLAMLLDLVEVATAGTLAMERDVQDEFNEIRRLAADTPTYASAEAPTLTASVYPEWTETWDGTVLFMDPPEAQVRGQSLPPWKLSTDDMLAASLPHARSVLEILDELRARAGLSRGEWLAPDGGTSEVEDVWNLTRGRHGERG